MDEAAARAAYEPAAREALKAFPIEPVDLKFVTLSENVTFRLTDARDGSTLVLRLHRPWYHDLEALKSERVWVRALAAAGIAVPPPVLTRDGQDYAPVDVATTGERRQAGLARWIDGEILADAVAGSDDAGNAARFERLGALMAALHDQASGWEPAKAFRRHVLDADGLMGQAPFWGPFWDHPVFSAQDRPAILAIRDRLYEALHSLPRDRATFSVIHADLHPGNVLVDGEALAVIDFDDTAFGWHAYDLAVALVAQQRHPAFCLFRDACVRGYRRVRPLPDAVVAQLPMFLLVRNLAQLGWLHQRPELPGPKPEWLEAMKALIQERVAAFEPPPI